MKLRGRLGRRTRTVPATALALLLLTGCAELTPGTAAVVNGTKISKAQVNDLADAQCQLRKVLTKAGTAQASSLSQVKQDSLALMMDAELSRQFGADKGIKPDKLLTNAFFKQVQPIFQPLPAKPRAEFTSVFSTWSAGRAILVGAGSKATGQEPTLRNLEQLLTAGVGVRNTWLKGADITTDPRYAPDKRGFPGGGDGSVSRAGSSFAKGASKSAQDAKWVQSLPAGQRCG